MGFGIKFSLTILALLALGAIFADLIAPYPYDLQNRKQPYHPPTKIYILKDGKLNFPYVKLYEMKDPLFKTYVETGKSCRLRFFSTTEFGFKLISVEKPCRLYLLGADKLGRDIFSRLLYGARYSLGIGLIGTAVTFALGALLGGISGYFGGRVDTFMMRVVEILMSIPTFYLLLSLRAVFPLEMTSGQIFLMIVFILSFLGWAGLARVVRGMVLSIREKEYVLSARVYGASTVRILRKHILPNTYHYLIVSATLSIPAYIVGESALSLLGLGIQEPQPSWGNMLAEVRSINILSSHPWLLSPGMMIFMTILAFNILGDSLLKKR